MYMYTCIVRLYSAEPRATQGARFEQLLDNSSMIFATSGCSDTL